MLVKVFILGRSGSGKTTVIDHMLWLAERGGYNALFVKDYPILYKMFQEDHNHARWFHPAKYGGFEVVDFDAFDNVLTQVEQQVREYMSFSQYDGIIFIEFARRDYQQALKKFTPAFLQDSYFFFVEAPVAICIERIRQRVSFPTTSDRHYVPEKMLSTYFSKDNLEYMASRFKEEYQVSKDVVAYSNTNTPKRLLEKVNGLYATILAKEFASTDQPPPGADAGKILIGIDK